jgi:hypothetical protein
MLKMVKYIQKGKNKDKKGAWQVNIAKVGGISFLFFVGRRGGGEFFLLVFVSIVCQNTSE